MGSEVQSGKIKTDISNHFAVFALVKKVWYDQILKNTFIKKDVNKDNFKYFKSILNSLDWSLITQNSTAHSSYKIFLDESVKIYDIVLKIKKMWSPWTVQALQKSSKKKPVLIWKVIKT